MPTQQDSASGSSGAAAHLLVLIIDDDPDDREACMRALGKIPDTRYRFEIALDGAAGLEAIAVHKPDVVLLDYFLPGSNGLAVLSKIREQEPFLPVIMLTGHGSEAVAARGIKAGANDYFNKAVLAETAALSVDEIAGKARRLHEAIAEVIAEQRSVRTSAVMLSEIRALLIDDSPDDREICRRALRRVAGVQYHFAEASDGQGGFAAIATHPPDIILLDYSLPGSDGMGVLSRIRQAYPFLPVIMLTGQGNEALAVRGIKAGAADYIVKSQVSGAVLHRAIVAAIEHHRDARTIDLQSRTIQRQREYLENSNHFLSSLLDHIPDPIFVKDSEHRRLLNNLAFLQLSGAAETPLMDAFWEADDLALKNDQPSISEQTVPGQNGAPRLFSIKRATFTDRAGEKVLVGIMRDISEQRQAEDDFKRQAVQLMSQSQDLARLGAILEDSLQEICIIDAATLLILQANKGARLNLGFTQLELERMSVLELSPRFTEEQFRQVLARLQAGEEVETVYHAAFKRKEGSFYEAEVHVQSAFFQGRHVLVHIALDETERTRVERMKSEFISKVSHELRTPLTSIRGAVGLLNAGAVGELPEKAAKMVKIADSNAARLARLVNDILTLEKSVAGQLTIDSRAVAVEDLLDQALESHAQYADKHKVRFVKDPVPAGLAVMADPGRLMQVLANLLSNAAKFSPPGGTVTLRAQEHGSGVRFEVEDTGCGIPENFRARIFEKFAQADSSINRRYEGSGLGLTITKQLIEAMGGRVWFESAVGRGTSFFFELPHPKIDKLKAATAENKVRVLICEDDPDSALIMKLFLEQAGLVTETAGLIQQARQRLGDQSFAVVILDLKLPDADGLTFLEELRARPETRGIPVLVVSGRAEEARRSFRGDAELVDWLVKPVSQEMLVESMRRAIQGGESLLRRLDSTDNKEYSLATPGEPF